MRSPGQASCHPARKIPPQSAPIIRGWLRAGAVCDYPAEEMALFVPALLRREPCSIAAAPAVVAPLPTRRLRRVPHARVAHARAAAAQVLALLLCGAGATSIRSLISSERLSDQASLALLASVTAGLLLSTALATRLVLSRCRGADRLVGAVLPLGLLVIAALFVRANMVDASVEMEAIVQPDGGAPEPAAKIELGPGGRDVRFSGEFSEGVATRLAAFLAAHPDVTRIALTSDGGLADEGQAVGDVIAAHKLDTFVPDFCVSACTLAFVRGKARLLQDDARLGFHAPYEEGLFGTTYRGDAGDQRAAYLSAGLAPDFVDAALKVDPSGIWFPPFARLQAAGVATGQVDRYRLPDSSLDGGANLAGARALVLRNYPLMAVFTARSPHGIDAIAESFLDAYDRGRSEGENADQLNAVVQAAVSVALTQADDATLVDVARYLQAAMDEADSDDQCAAIGSQADLVSAARVHEDDGGTFPEATALLGRALADRHATIGPALLMRASVQTNSSGSCAGLKRAYTSLLAQPPGRAAAEMRQLVDSQAARALSVLQLTPAKVHG